MYDKFFEELVCQTISLLRGKIALLNLLDLLHVHFKWEYLKTLHACFLPIPYESSYVVTTVW